MKNLIYIILAFLTVFFGGPFREEPKLISPVDGSFARLDGGRTIAVQNGFSLRFFDTESGEVREIFLKPHAVKKAGKCSFSNEFIFLPGEGAALIANESGIFLSGCDLYRRDGSLFREFPESRGAVKNALPVERTFFIGDGLLVLKSGGREFTYNLYTDEIKSTRNGCFFYQPLAVQVLLSPESIFLRRFLTASDFASMSPARIRARFVSIGPTSS